MRVLSLDADDGSLAFGLHEVDPNGVSTLFERVVGMARSRGLQASPLTGLPGSGSIKEAILGAVKLAFSYGRLDSVGCRVRLRAQSGAGEQEEASTVDAATSDLGAAMAASMQAMEFAMELLPGVPVVAVFDADIAAVEPSESPLDESSRIAVSAYRSASKAER